MNEVDIFARRLIDFVAEAGQIEIDVERFPVTLAEESGFIQESGLAERFYNPANQILSDLERALARLDGDTIIAGSGETGQGRWSLGTAMTLRGPSREIHAGYLQPLQRVPILSRVPERVVLHLITIDRGEDYLANETHSGVGWHYHYLDRRKKRSDVVLCWDTRWTDPSPQTEPPSRRGLFVEKHAEGGKPFRAKPWLWGSRKRETMYSVCDADLRKRQIDEYRCASNKADPVYPVDATLTPHASASALLKSAGHSSTPAAGRCWRDPKTTRRDVFSMCSSHPGTGERTYRRGNMPPLILSTAAQDIVRGRRRAARPSHGRGRWRR